MVRQSLAGGGVALRPANDDMTPLHASELVVIDPDSGEIVARTLRDALFMEFVGRETLIELVQLEDGTPQIVLWRATLHDAR